MLLKSRIKTNEILKCGGAEEVSNILVTEEENNSYHSVWKRNLESYVDK